MKQRVNLFVLQPFRHTRDASSCCCLGNGTNKKTLSQQFPRIGLTSPLTDTIYAPLGVRLTSQTTGSASNSATPGAEQVPSSADVVVIGGGSLGCSALYHLTKHGVTNAVLLEANKLTAGTTWHTAGLIWRLRPSDTELQILHRTREVLTRIESETGVNCGWINNGGLYIASSKERMDEYKRLYTLGRSQGIESHLLTPAETEHRFPLINVEDVYGTLFCPGSGTVDAAGICEALTRGAKKAGAQVFEDCPVTGISTSPTLLGGRQVTQVQTAKGNITTNNVINATGAWGKNVAAMVGLNIPLVSLKHAYVVTEKIPGVENMPNIRDHDLSCYFKLQGDALCIGGYEQNPHFTPKMNLDFAFGLYDLDYDVFDSLYQGHMKRMPVLETIGVKSTICGPESFTPDHKPIMGEDPNVQGFYHCCGFNSAGMMLGGGCGDAIARWVVHGRPDLDMFGYDVRRFYNPLFKDEQWAKERTHEAYAKNYSIVFPHDEPLAGRGMRKSPLHEILEEQGCAFQERHGWERPGWFNSSVVPVQKYDWYGVYDHHKNEDQRYYDVLKKEYSFEYPSTHRQINAECQACRTAVAGFDMSYFGKFFITGPDAAKAVDYLFTADMRRKVGSVVYTCMLNDRGGVEGDLTVSVLDSGSGSACDPIFNESTGYYLAVGGAAATQIYGHVIKEIRQHKWDVKITDHTENMALLSVQGPKSRDLLSSLTKEDLSNEVFPFGSHKVMEVAGQKLRALRVSFVGELGWELHVPNESALKLYKAVAEAGKKFGFVNSGYRAMDSLSCEKGYRHWHADIRPDDTPLEAGLGFTCKLKTGIDFKGRQALEKQKAEGIHKKLVTVTMDDFTVPLWGLEGIKRDGDFVGFVRRAEYGVSLGTNIAYGYVKKPDESVVDKDFLSSGQWSLEVMGKDYPVKLHTKHPFDPQNNRIKGFY